MALKFVVFATPHAGREDEFFAWYDEEHLPHMLELDGFQSFKRYDQVSEPDRPAAPGGSMVIFDLDVESPQAVRAILAQAQADNRMPLHDSMDRSKTRSWFFSPVGE